MAARACPAAPARTVAAEGTEAVPGTGHLTEDRPRLGQDVQAGLAWLTLWLSWAGQGCDELEPRPAGVGPDGPRVLTWGPGPEGLSKVSLAAAP